VSDINTVGLNKEQINLLEGSFNALKNKGDQVLVSDQETISEIFTFLSEVKLSMRRYTFYPKNIFKIDDYHHGYIIQCALDFNNWSSRYGQIDDGVEVQVWGYAKTKNSLGNTLMRPETKLDKVINRFVRSDINFKEKVEFSSKYYLTSNRPDEVRSLFTPPLLNEIQRSSNLNLYTNDKQLLVGFFDEPLSVGNTVKLEKIILKMIHASSLART
jgi:hypothetical protein